MMSQQKEQSKDHPAIVCVADVFDEIGARRKRWNEEKRIGLVGYDEEFKALCFYFEENPSIERYHVYLRDLAAAESQMQWLNHLRRKNWFTREAFNDLMDAMELLGLIKQGL